MASDEAGSEWASVRVLRFGGGTLPLPGQEVDQRDSLADRRRASRIPVGVGKDCETQAHHPTYQDFQDFADRTDRNCLDLCSTFRIPDIGNAGGECNATAEATK